MLESEDASVADNTSTSLYIIVHSYFFGIRHFSPVFSIATSTDI